MAILDEASFGFVVDAPFGNQTAFSALIGTNLYGYSASAFLGDVTVSGDLDSYELKTDIGSSYTILTGDSPGFWGDEAGVTSVAVNDAAGALVALTGPSEDGLHGTSFTATEDTYYLTAFSDSVGYYGFRVINNTTADTTPVVNNNGTVSYSAALDFASDLDGFSVSLNQGDTIDVTLTSDGIPFFLGIQNSVLQTVDVGFVEGTGSHQFTAPSTDLFSLQLVANDGRATGSYTLSTSVDFAPTGDVVITGTTRQGEELTADMSAVDDANGLGVFSYEWSRDGVPIGGADGATYVLVRDDVGAQISVVVSFTDDDGNDEALTSASTDVVVTNGQLITGTFEPDELDGTAGWDTIFALDGDDSLTGGEGGDTLNGGDGVDTGIYSGNQASYTLTLGATETTLTDRRTDGNGTDHLIDMELLDFETDLLGAPFDLEKFAGLSGLSGEELESFIELYIAYFNRAPDAIGLFFWGTAFANGTTLEEMATLFIDQDETRATYPDTLSNAAFAAEVYGNVLGRIPDLLGFNFWVELLDSGAVSRDQFILEVLRGAKADAPPGATQEFLDQQLIDRKYLADKTDIGAYFAVHKGMSDVEDAAAVMALFDGSAASISSAVASIEAFHSEALDAATGAFLMPLIGVLDDPFFA